MSKSDNTTKEHKSIFREPWGWFVLSPLIAVVLVSSVTVTIAVTGADDVVSDNYYREGRMINHDFSAGENAAAMGVGGILLFDKHNREILFEKSASNAKEIRAETIQLYLSHPLEAEKDVTVSLQQGATGVYSATLFREISGRWYVRLSGYETAEENTELWRLDSEIDFATTNQLVFR